jgi:predicted transcriptional regulator of viral defense system
MKNEERLLELVKQKGIIRVQDLVTEDIHPEYLRILCEKGLLVKENRGLYSAAGSEITENHGMAQVAKWSPKGVICLLSALQFHEIGTQGPHEVWLALEGRAASPQIEWLPVRVVRFSGKAFNEGIEVHKLEGVEVRIYNPAKTVVDCFRFRNKIGFDVALEALRDSLRSKKCTVDELWKYAGFCRMTNVMRPYMETLV